MPELKRTFNGGRMDKDSDERTIGNGLYREALNVSVSTSEGSDVGAAQNILSNIPVTEAASGPNFYYNACCGVTNLLHGRYSKNAGGDRTLCNKHIAAVVDQQTDMMYRFIATEAPDAGVWMDRILEYDTSAAPEDPSDGVYGKEKPVMIDVYRVETRINNVWQIDPNPNITGDECNKSWIRVCKNPFQLKPGMVLAWDNANGCEIDNTTYIEHIQWEDNGWGPEAVIRLSTNLLAGASYSCLMHTDIRFSSDRVLNFSPNRPITGLNVVDGMIFWTDDYSEPKKINIERGKLGSKHDPSYGGKKNTNLHAYGGSTSGGPCPNGDALNNNISANKFFFFDIPTKLIVDGQPVTECFKDEMECPQVGCTDPTAMNYDPTATFDDGSCEYCVYGCTDPSVGACGGYDPNATCDDGSCCYIRGCTNPYSSAYDPTACCDDGSCEDWQGCFDAAATNYGLACNGDDLQTIVANLGLNWPPSGAINSCCEYKWSCVPPGYQNDDCDGPFVDGLQAGTPLLIANNATTASAHWDNIPLAVLDAHGTSGGDPLDTLWWWKDYPYAPPTGYWNLGACILPSSMGYKMKHKGALVKFSDIVITSNSQRVQQISGSQGDFTNSAVTSQINWLAGAAYTANGGLDVNGNPLEFTKMSCHFGADGGINYPATASANFDPGKGIFSWDYIVDFLESESIFDGNYNHYDYNTNTWVPIPHVNTCNTWQDLINLMTQDYYLTETGSDQFRYRGPEQNMPFGCNCGGTFQEECECKKDENGIYDTKTECETATTPMNCCSQQIIVPVANPPILTPDQPVTGNDISINTTGPNTPGIGDNDTPGEINTNPFNANQEPSSQRSMGGGGGAMEGGAYSPMLYSPSPLKLITFQQVVDQAVNWQISVSDVGGPLRGTPEPPISGEGFGPTITISEVEENKICNFVYVQEKHITVIRKGPTSPIKLEMYSWDEEADVNPMYGYVQTSASTISHAYSVNLETSFTGINMPHGPYTDPSNGMTVTANTLSGTGTAVDGSTKSIFYNEYKELKGPGDIIILPIDITAANTPMDWKVGYQLIIEHEYTNSFGVPATATCRAQITAVTSYDPVAQTFTGVFEDPDTLIPSVQCQIMGITSGFPIGGYTMSTLYTVKTVQKPAIFEKKFPRFGYRYKYEDGEYSVFSPWSEVAFIPGDFDYLPKKGYNLGMVNNLRTLKLLNWRPKDIPHDVVQVDILYKESNSPNVYTVDSHKRDDLAPVGSTRPWDIPGTGNNFGVYTVDSELIHKVVPANQMLRPWDNVPRYAKAQEITAGRLIFANYVENYNLEPRVASDGKLKPEFEVSLKTQNLSWDRPAGWLNEEVYALIGPKNPIKSLKSMRTYQMGVVYRDRYGRETPVLTSSSGSIKIPKKNSNLQNKLNVRLTTPPPYWAESYTFYIKETSNEYYNVPMDRWYDAEDEGIWVSFTSAERNKISERSTLILKKEHNSDKYVTSDVRYKVLDVKNDAPDFIKTKDKYWGAIPMMLPPPGWGYKDKVGNWDTGMFAPTGIPLPGRLYLDVYAEYFDQSVLSGLLSLESAANAQVRIIQSPNQTSAYASSMAPEQINRSRWYDVANINYIGTPQDTYTETVSISGININREVEVPGQPEQLVRITLDQAMGADMAFCEPEDNLSLNRNLSLEARTREKVEKSQFEGRFFVKILRDIDIERHIVEPTQKTEDAYQVLFSRDISYICMAHPGVQDWMTGESGTMGAGKGKYYNVGHSENLNYLQPAQPFYNQGENDYQVREVSSLSKKHGDAYYKKANSGSWTLEGPPQTGKLWPWGNSIDMNTALVRVSSNGHDSYWLQTYSEYIRDIGVQFGSGWLQKARDHYNAYASLGTAFLDTWTKDTQPWNDNDKGAAIPDAVDPSWGYESGWPAYQISSWNPKTCGSLNGIGCGVYTNTDFWSGQGSSMLDLSDVTHPLGGNLNDYHDQYGANPYNLPAIWGDQSDFTNATNANWTVSASSNNQAIYDHDTIKKLRKDWYYLWYGRDKMDKKWPLSRHSPLRWFIDKVGAAKGYSGNGIWDDESSGTPVSKMDISYWGIGHTRKHYRNFDLLYAQDNEYPMMEMLMTPGTQFRFKQDPDQIVYTVTKAEKEYCFNYEAQRGSWGYDDGSGVIDGGGGIGTDMAPPFGSATPSSGAIAGTGAFYSDMFVRGTSVWEHTGGWPANYRTRITITLDKVIGSEGQNNFHPITNHIDADGNCNVKGGAKRYWADSTLDNSNGDWIGEYEPAEEIGGTPSGIHLFNLESYWNNTNTITAPYTQDSTSGVGDVDGARFGLHERGLNHTTIEIVVPYKGEDAEQPQSDNPGIWETEPMEDVGLDIYYAASPTYPIDIEKYRWDYRGSAGAAQPDPLDFHAWNPGGQTTYANWYDYGFRGEEIIPVGAKIDMVNPTAITPIVAQTPIVLGVQNNMLWLDRVPMLDTSSPTPTPVPYTVGDKVKISWPGEGSFYGGQEDINMIGEFGNIEITKVINVYEYEITSNTHNINHTLNYFNCYSFSNGVESNRVRDDYNAVTIDKGVKASMPLAGKEYEEERKGSGLIFSGIYNSRNGINRSNQFIQAEPITKDLNPVNGTIQKLYTRDTDLLTFCENKVFKILAQKDALFNADGNTNVTANNRVLGQAIPFTGEYGISKDPQSFAAESYRCYFTDKARGAVIRLSRDGLTPISDAGMKDWFKDHLKWADQLLGSYNEREGHYNLTLETANDDGDALNYTVSYTEKVRGWESFKSFLTQGGISHKNYYYSFPSNNWSFVDAKDVWGVNYSGQDWRDHSVNSNNIQSENNHKWVPGSDFYPTLPLYSGEMFLHNIDTKITRGYDKSGETAGMLWGASTWGSAYVNGWIRLDGSYNGQIRIGMNVEGNGVPYGTVVSGVYDCETYGYLTGLAASKGGQADYFAAACNTHGYFPGASRWVRLANYKELMGNGSPLDALWTMVNIEDGAELTFTSRRNQFYGVSHYSQLTTIHPGDPATVKRYQNISYEGSQASLIGNTMGPGSQYQLHQGTGLSSAVDVGAVYYDEWMKTGWFVQNIETDMQEGSLREFIEKENKWYNYIRGIEGVEVGDDLDTAEFSLQGLGWVGEYSISSDTCPNVSWSFGTPAAIAATNNPSYIAMIGGQIAFYVDLPASFVTMPSGLSITDAEVNWQVGCAAIPIGGNGAVISNMISQGLEPWDNLYPADFNQIPDRIVVQVPTSTVIGSLCGDSAYYGGFVEIVWNRGQVDEIKCKKTITDTLVKLGCTDISATNYDPNANFDNGTCTGCS